MVIKTCCAVYWLATAVTVLIFFNQNNAEVATNNLQKELFMKLQKIQGNKNLITSYASFTCPLTKLAISSTGETKDELMSALGINAERLITDKCSQLNFHLPRDLLLVNEIYYEEGNTVSKNFTDICLKWFLTDVQPVGFKKYPLSSYSYINRRVSEKTLRRINDILKLEDVNNMTSMIMTSAAHFKASWEYIFDKKNTKLQDFTTITNKVVQVPTMYQANEYSYIDSTPLEAEVINLPLFDYGACMTIVLPRSVTGLKNIMAALKRDPNVLLKVKKNMKFRDIDLYLPKFQIKTEAVDLTGIFKEIGIKRIFVESYSGLTNFGSNSSNGMYLNKVKQKMFIQFDESGTQGFEIQRGVDRLTIDERTKLNYHRGFGSQRPDFIEVRVNKPFYFVIYSGFNREIFQGLYFASEHQA